MSKRKERNAIILVSGGLDSVVTAYYVKKKMRYNRITFLFFSYGQKTAKQEEHFSRKNAKILGAEFIKIELRWLGEISKSLVNLGKNKASTLKDINKKNEMFLWYVPARNTLFISYALALAESYYLQGGCYDIFVGFKNEGKMHYPDTTRSFIYEFNNLKNKAVIGKFMIKAPLLRYDKDGVVLLGKELGVNFGDTYSCYHGSGWKHCGLCMNCRLRQEGFYWANIIDPTEYASKTKDYRDANTI